MKPSKPTGKLALAVAIAYEAPHVPRVVAVGSGDLGERIIATAREHGVPIEQNTALAQALSTIELDEEIPEQLYTAIAQILAFILRVSGKLPLPAEGRPLPIPPR